jgi:hypothetical protein
MAVIAAGHRKAAEASIERLERSEADLEATVGELRSALSESESRREEGAEGAAAVDYSDRFIPNLLNDPAAGKKLEMLKESYVTETASTALRYLNKSLGCEGALGRIFYDEVGKSS